MAVYGPDRLIAGNPSTGVADGLAAAVRMLCAEGDPTAATALEATRSAAASES